MAAVPTKSVNLIMPNVLHGHNVRVRIFRIINLDFDGLVFKLHV